MKNGKKRAGRSEVKDKKTSDAARKKGRAAATHQ